MYMKSFILLFICFALTGAKNGGLRVISSSRETKTDVIERVWATALNYNEDKTVDTVMRRMRDSNPLLNVSNLMSDISAKVSPLPGYKPSEQDNRRPEDRPNPYVKIDQTDSYIRKDKYLKLKKFYPEVFAKVDYLKKLDFYQDKIDKIETSMLLFQTLETNMNKILENLEEIFKSSSDWSTKPVFSLSPIRTGSYELHVTANIADHYCFEGKCTKDSLKKIFYEILYQQLLTIVSYTIDAKSTLVPDTCGFKEYETESVITQFIKGLPFDDDGYFLQSKIFSAWRRFVKNYFVYDEIVDWSMPENDIRDNIRSKIVRGKNTVQIADIIDKISALDSIDTYLQNVAQSQGFRFDSVAFLGDKTRLLQITYPILTNVLETLQAIMELNGIDNTTKISSELENKWKKWQFAWQPEVVPKPKSDTCELLPRTDALAYQGGSMADNVGGMGSSWQTHSNNFYIPTPDNWHVWNESATDSLINREEPAAIPHYTTNPTAGRPYDNPAQNNQQLRNRGLDLLRHMRSVQDGRPGCLQPDKKPCTRADLLKLYEQASRIPTGWDDFISVLAATKPFVEKMETQFGNLQLVEEPMRIANALLSNIDTLIDRGYAEDLAEPGFLNLYPYALLKHGDARPIRSLQYTEAISATILEVFAELDSPRTSNEFYKKYMSSFSSSVLENNLSEIVRVRSLIHEHGKDRATNSYLKPTEHELSSKLYDSMTGVLYFIIEKMGGIPSGVRPTHSLEELQKRVSKYNTLYVNLGDDFFGEPLYKRILGESSPEYDVHIYEEMLKLSKTSITLESFENLIHRGTDRETITIPSAAPTLDSYYADNSRLRAICDKGYPYNRFENEFNSGELYMYSPQFLQRLNTMQQPYNLVPERDPNESKSNIRDKLKNYYPVQTSNT